MSNQTATTGSRTSAANETGIMQSIGRTGMPVLIAASALIILVIFFSITSPIFLTTTNFSNLLRQGSVLIVVALAGTFVIMLGSIDLSVGSIVTLSGVTAAMAVTAYGAPGALVAVAAGAGVGLANGVLHAYGKLPSFLVTLGMLSIAEGVSLTIAGGRPVPLPISSLDSIMGGIVFGIIPVISLWAFGLWGLMWFISARTVFGRRITAIGDGERVAKIAGIPVQRTKLLVFTLSGSLAAIGGVMLTVRTASGSPGMGESFLLDSIAAIVIGGTALTGGVGGPARTILGALLITVLSNGMTLLSVDPFYQVIIRGAVVIFAVAITIRRRELSLIK